MDKFGFVIHVVDSELMAKAFREPGLELKGSNRIYSKRTVERSLRWFPPFKCADITGIRSPTGDEIKGFFIFCPLIPEQILNMDKNFVLQRIIESCQLAQDMGAKIVGLGAYTAQVGRRGVQVSKKVTIPVTTGTSYTVAIAVDSTLKAAEDLGMPISESKIAVIGASGGIGSIFSHLIASRAKEIILVARNMTRLENIGAIVKKESGKTPILMQDVRKAVKEADIIMFSTNDPHSLIKEDDIQPGAIICDISVPKNVSEEIVRARKDILVIDGGVVKPPGDVKLNFYFGPPPGLVYACIAETMILTLEKRFESYSLGDNIDIKKVIEIKKMADKHGFKLAEFRSFYGEITQERLRYAKKAIAQRFKMSNS